MTVEELKGSIQKCNINQPYIFVSYKREDADKVYPLVIELQKQGINIWIDKEMKGSVGENWQEPAFDAIYACECKAILLFVSKNSLASAPILAELAYSQEQKVVDSHDGKLTIYSFDLNDVLGNKEDKKDKKDKPGSMKGYVSEVLRKEFIKEKINRGDLEEMFPENKLRNFWDEKDWPENNFQIANAILQRAGIKDDKTIIANDITEIIESCKKRYSEVFNLTVSEEVQSDSDKEEKKPEQEDTKEPKTKGVKTEVKLPISGGCTESSRTLRDMLFEFMDKYDEQVKGCKNAATEGEKEKFKPGKSNWLYKMVINDVPQIIKDKVLTDEMYDCKSSVGAGRWAGCPWIAVFNKYITYSVMQGVYIVYLLNRETKELYLTLNQGVTRFKKMADEKGVKGIKEAGYKKADDYVFALLKESVAQIRNEVEIGDFSAEEISTGDEGYDFGCICSKKYSISDLPADDVLIADIEAMLKIYDKYFEIHKDEYSSMKERPKNERKSGGKTAISTDGVKVSDRGIL